MSRQMLGRSTLCIGRYRVRYPTCRVFSIAEDSMAARYGGVAQSGPCPTLARRYDTEKAAVDRGVLRDAKYVF